MGLITILFDSPMLFMLIAISLIFALCVHEFSHGYVAYINGDETAYKMGRLTLNPLDHLDPIGSLMILFVGFGYAKPVPVNPMNLNNPRRDLIKVAAAGPISNFILSFLGIFLYTVFIKLNIVFNSMNIFFTYFILINTYLGLFNLIPVYPLDGGQIFGNIISKYNPNIFHQLNQYGPKILLGAILLSVFTQGKISVISWIIEKPAMYIVSLFEKISKIILFFI
tara:strand:+ start:602 stop:1273 length:672 start_codon:yes stop_codon:yes gene_type:complete